MSQMKHNAMVLIESIDEATQIFESSASWETKYNLIFNLNIWQQAKKLGLQHDWVDPDMDYEDDVRAYMTYVTALGKEVRTALYGDKS